MEQNPSRSRPAEEWATIPRPVEASRSNSQSVAPIPDSRSGVVALLLEERKDHAEVLADRDRLLAVFSHDLKNLMNALVLNGHVRSRREGTSGDPNDISPQVLVRMDRLISNLLDLTRVNAGKLRVEPIPSSTMAVVQEAVRIFRPLAAQKQLALELSASDDVLEANLDHDRIFQVLSNLLTNAIRFTAAGGTISVRASRSEGVIQVDVQDTGSGIQEADLERIFDCYRQVNAAHVEGLGLGLFIARSIVEAHGGRIWVTSEPGVGSTFSFTLSALPVSAPD